jgi:hypothetical protein
MLLPGARLITAVPDVQMSNTGFWSCCAMPREKYPAERSSTMLWQDKEGFKVKAIVIGALREPGEITTFSMPAAWHR